MPKARQCYSRLLTIAGFFSFQRVSSRRLIGVTLVSVHMGAVRISKMVGAGWPGPEAPQDLVPWPSVCAVATIFDEPAVAMSLALQARPRTALALAGPICAFLHTPGAPTRGH